MVHPSLASTLDRISLTSNSAPSSVLFINRVYPPVGGATGAILAELASDLVADGWRVGVVTGSAPEEPTYTVTESGVHVHRVWSVPFSRQHHLQRMGAYLALYPMLLARALRLDDYDVVVTKTDPPLQLALGPLIQALTGCTLVHWAQDLYPEIAEAVGVIEPGGWLADALRRLSTWALRRHDHVFVVGRCMRARMISRGVEADRISVMPNWPPDSVTPVPHTNNPFRTQHGMDSKFVVMYSGNMGLAHTFAPIVEAADQLRDREDIVFVLVGDGPRRSELESCVRERKLENMRFLPFQSEDQLAESLSAGDVHLVTMREGTEGLVVPSKTYGVMAAGRPCVFLGAAESEAARLVGAHDCGTVLPNPTGAQLAEVILRWKRDPARRKAAERRAADAVAGARARAVRQFQEVIREAQYAHSS